MGIRSHTMAQMETITFFFAGSGHGLDYEDDNVVRAFKHTNGPKAFFPGPGGGDPVIYVGFAGDRNWNPIAVSAKSTGWLSSAKKRSATGKGWNRNVLAAVVCLARFITAKGAVRLNLVGHSRGSISIIMLLNDLFFQSSHGIGQGATGNFTVAGTKFGTKSISRDAERPEFDKWYEDRLRKIWTSRASAADATEGIQCLTIIRNAQNWGGGLSEINVFMFDPVGGAIKVIPRENRNFRKTTK